MADYSEHLKKCTMFADVEEAHLDALGRGCRRRSFRARDPLFFEGDPGGTMYIILSGAVSIERVNEQGKIVSITTRVAGEVIGELSIFDEAPRNADAKASTDADVLVLDRQHVLSCLRSSDRLALNVIRTLVSKLREATDRSTSGLSDSVRQMVAKQLIIEARRSGVKEPGRGVVIQGRITHQELASRAGCSRETITRVLRGLQDQGAIGTTASPFLVTSVVKLKKAAGANDE